MDFDDYQDAAAGTDQFAGKKVSKDEGLMIPLLGIAGETGTLLAEFKKKIRDKESYQGFKDKAEEELGDVLWYLANIATRLDLSLSEIASKKPSQNERALAHCAGDDPPPGFFPFFRRRVLCRLSACRAKLTFRIYEIEKGHEAHMWKSTRRAKQIGSPLTDNAYGDDGSFFPLM